MFSLTGLPQAVRRALKWDAVSAAIGGVSNGALFPFLGVILRRDLHASAYLIATLGAAFALGNLFNPLMAHSIRNRAKLPFAVWPPIISRSFFLLMPFAVAAPSFVGITVVGSAFGSLAAPAYAAVIRDAYPVERRGRLMGFVRVVFVGGAMLGSLGGGIALHYISYRWVFPVAALLGIVGVSTFARVGVPAAPDEPAPPGARMLDAFRIVAADRLFGLYSMAFFLYAFGNLILSPVFPVFQVDVMHISTQWVSYLSMSAAGLSMVGYLYWGRVLDRRGPFFLFLCVLGVAAFTPVIYFFAHDVHVLLFAAMAQGLAQAGGDLGYVNASMRFAKRELVVSYAAVFAFLQAMRGIPGPFIGAALSNWLGPRPVFLVVFGLWAAAVVVASVGLRRARNATMEQ
jgi:MFS family permease